jgi:hypothetical protein
MDHYPDSKVILSLRDPECWYESAMETIFKGFTTMKGRREEVPPALRDLGEMAVALIEEGTFGGDVTDHDNAIRVYNEHNELVRRTVAPERLLVFEAAEGWEPLCAFLDRPVPDEPYPRVNSRDDFVARDLIDRKQTI